MPLEERPLTAFILSLLGGLFVVVGTGLGFVLYSSSPYGYVSELTGILVGVSIAFGILMLTMTMLLYLRRARRRLESPGPRHARAAVSPQLIDTVRAR